jgi:hypothetical protein
MLLVHSGTASTLRTRAFREPAYNLVRVEPERIVIELCIAGAQGRSLGEYPRTWAAELSTGHVEPFGAADRGPALVND